jgi:hypothetical protein
MVVLLLGVAALGLIYKYGLSFLFFYETTALPRGFALMEAAERGLFLGEEDHQTFRVTNFEFEGETDFCATYDFTALAELKTRNCFFVGFGRIEDYCRFWWLGRRCISVSITQETRGRPELYERIKEIITHPCRYLFDTRNTSLGSDYINKLTKYRRVLGCNEENFFKTYSVALLIMGEPIDGPSREVLDVVWLEAVTP